jgi:hypothetical protein
LSPASRGPFPPVTFRADGGGLTIAAKSHDAAIEFHQPGGFTEEQFAVPFDVLKRCEGGKADAVTLERIDQRVTVQWSGGGIPQVIQADAETTDDDFLAVPSELRPNDARLVCALRDAAATTDNDATRYALNCLQLQGERGKIAATDGHQLLVQGGFDFPWDDDVLIPARKVFASRELHTDQPVEVGKSDDWVCVRIGQWALQFQIEKESRFPRVEDHIPDANSAATTLRLSDADAMFLAKAVKRLPGSDDYNSPVTVDLNGTVAIRAKSEGQSVPTELILTNSSRSGEAIRFNTNREFLARAMKLGFRDVHLTGPEAPEFCCDRNRQYLWMLLGKDGAIESSPEAIRIESPHVDDVSDSPKPNSKRKRPTMSQSKTNRNGQTRRNGTDTGSDGQAGVESLIEQAEAVKTSLRETLTNTSELIASLKKHRKQSRLVRSTLASLRQLQSIDA